MLEKIIDFLNEIAEEILEEQKNNQYKKETWDKLVNKELKFVSDLKRFTDNKSLDIAMSKVFNAWHEVKI